GYLLSSDTELVARVRAAIPIWNVNGFGESFLRLLPRYLDAFEESCARVRDDRDALAAELREIRDLTVFQPDGNFVFLRLPDQWTGPEVVMSLFTEHGIIVKDCVGKSMADGECYLRISSRTTEENSRLVEVLAELLARRPASLASTAHGG